MKVLISGSGGTIGQVLVGGLPHEVTEFDLPECDARVLDQFAEAARGHDALVHLAWDVDAENSDNGALDVDNMLMVFNAYQAALRSGVRRVIMASSIHADGASHPSDGLLAASGVPIPDSPYGASKVFAEALGRHFAVRGLEVVAVRFGGVDHLASIRDFKSDTLPHPDWLSHADCVACVNACLTVPEVPERFAVLYAVSDNPGSVYDLTNPFAWVPEPWSRRRVRFASWMRNARAVSARGKTRVFDPLVRRGGRRKGG